MSIHIQAVVSHSSNLTPSTVVGWMNNDAECTARGNAKEPPKTQVDVHSDYTIRFDREETILRDSQ